jgi:esterase/lipase superfamily enzyme
VRLKAKASSPGGHPLRYGWAVSGGSVIGDGTDVVWDLSGAQPGVYQATVTVESGPAGGLSAMAFVSKSVVVRQCPKPSAETGGEAGTSERPVTSSRQQGVEKIEVGELSGTIADCGELEVLLGSAQPEMPTATGSEIGAPRTRNGHGPGPAPAQPPELRLPPPPLPTEAGGVVGETEQFYKVRIFYGTDRKPTGSRDPYKHYSGQRGAEEGYEAGVCDLTIPKTHATGHIEKPPSILWYEFPANPAKHFILQKVTPLGHEEFFSRLHDSFTQTGGTHALVFVHGFNVNFAQAAERTAQLAFDLKFPGVPILYSWPSLGTTSSPFHYTTDEENNRWTVAHLKQFLEDVAARLGPDARIHLIAHSMGNRALTEALRDIAGKPQAPRFSQVILTAPDIDAAIFKRDLAPAIQLAAAQVTLYASSDDATMQLAKRLRSGYPRAGESGDGIIAIPGVVTIDATGIDTSLLGHSYYAEVKDVLADMQALIMYGHGPAERKLHALTKGAATYWRLVAAGPPGPAVVVPGQTPQVPGAGGVPLPALLLVVALVLAAVLFFVWRLIRRRRGRQPAAGGGGRM